jgi:HAMP domain-containing protein
METKISRNLERCSEIADQLQDCSWSTTTPAAIGEVSKEVMALAQELGRLIEDLFVMTGTEDAREASIDQKLRDAAIDPNAMVERTLDMIMDQPTARDEMPETMEELADREESDVESGLQQMSDASDIIAETIKNLNEVYRHAMMQGERMSLSPEQSLRAQQHPSMRKK